MRGLALVARLTLPVVAASVVGCGANITPTTFQYSPSGRAARVASPASSTPALIAFDTLNGSLGYWPIQHGGGETLQPLSGSLGIHNGYALAANSNVVIVANYQPAEIVTYNVRTKAQASMNDPYGDPYDVAVDKKGTIYAMNVASVAVYAKGSSQPSELTCSYITTSEAIAVNNERDVFVDGYGPQGFQGVIEYAAGSTNCTEPRLRATRGYIGGVGVDPKTDDLIVVDDPDFCAGGLEGRMIIYPKPYRQRTSIRRILSATYCAGTFRLDAASRHIFYSDATVSAGFPLIDQARYPSGKYEGQYENGYYSGGNFAGFTTIPNALPN